MDQQADDTDPGVFTEGLERHDAVMSRNGGNGPVTWGKAIKRNELFGLACLGHGFKDKIAQTAVQGKPIRGGVAGNALRR